MSKPIKDFEVAVNQLMAMRANISATPPDMLNFSRFIYGLLTVLINLAALNRKLEIRVETLESALEAHNRRHDSEAPPSADFAKREKK